jgi:hypothetical protein
MPAALRGGRQGTESVMKKFPIAAAALLFGSSAYAMIPSTQPTGVWVEKDPYAVTQTAALGSAAGVAPAFQAAAVDWWNVAEPVAYVPDRKPAPKSVAAGETVKAEAMASQAAIDDAMIAAHEDAIAADVQLAAYNAAVQPAPAAPVDATLYTASADTVSAADQPVQMAAADLTPRPAAQNYPACRPGPGDDHCIQLYEPGVEQRLAAWQQPTGGFAGAGDTQVAMGGPYEALDDSAVETARADIPEGSELDGNMALSSADTDDEDVAEI